MASTFNKVKHLSNTDKLKFEAAIIEDTISGYYYNSIVSNIVANRFDNCTHLQSVEFPNAETIGKEAFAQCTSLETVVFNAATSIESNVFLNCTSLHEVQFDALTPMPASFSTSKSFTSINFGAITTLPNSRSNNFGTFLSNTKATLQSIYFNGITGSIPSYYFSTFTALKTAEFQNATLITSYAFVNCTSLEEFYGPKVITINRNAFSNCYNLSIINVSKTEAIGIQAFFHCSVLSSINLLQCSALGPGCFESCIALESFYGPRVVTFSSDRQFAACTALKTINFENLATLTGNRTNNSNTIYLGATNIEEISFQKIVTVPSYYFASYSKLQKIWLPSAITLSNYAFRYCIGLSRVEFDAVQTLGVYTFAGNTNLEVAKFMNLSRINGNTFNGCTKLSKLYILGSSMAILSGASNNFTNAGITATTGAIYVPSSLVATYQANASWSRYKNIIQSYVFNSYSARLMPTTIPFENSTAYSLYASNATTAAVVGTVPHGVTVTILSTIGSWFYAQYETSSGWIQGAVVRDLPPD